MYNVILTQIGHIIHNSLNHSYKENNCILSKIAYLLHVVTISSNFIIIINAVVHVCNKVNFYLLNYTNIRSVV